MYSENYNIVMKEIKDDTNRRRDKPYTSTGRINILKIYYSRQSTDSMQFLSIYQGHFFFFFLKPFFSLFILKSALYKTTREKSLRVKEVGREGGEDDPEMKPPSHLGDQAETGPQASPAGPLMFWLYS